MVDTLEIVVVGTTTGSGGGCGGANLPLLRSQIPTR